MIGSTAVRVYIVAALILLTYGGAHLVKAALEPPEVDIARLDFQRDAAADSATGTAKTRSWIREIAVATGAQVDRRPRVSGRPGTRHLDAHGDVR